MPPGIRTYTAPTQVISRIRRLGDPSGTGSAARNGGPVNPSFGDFPIDVDIVIIDYGGGIRRRQFEGIARGSSS